MKIKILNYRGLKTHTWMTLELLNIDKSQQAQTEKSNQFVTPNSKKRCISKLAKNRPSSLRRLLVEYELFGQHIAVQMRALPVRSFVPSQETFQILITKESLKYMMLDSSTTPESNESTTTYISDKGETRKFLDQDLLQEVCCT